MEQYNWYVCVICDFKTDDPKVKNCLACGLKGEKSVLAKVEGELGIDFSEED